MNSKQKNEIILERKTKETEIKLNLNIDGRQNIELNTGLPFFDHMLNQLGFHSGWDLKITAKGDLEVDDHHLIEDVAIVLGQALQKSWRAKTAIRRYGQRYLPMDATLVLATVDICGRAYAVTSLPFSRESIGGIATEMWKHFFYTFAINAGITLHIKAEYFDNNHHLVEASFKALALAFKECLESVVIENSTKGVL